VRNSHAELHDVRPLTLGKPQGLHRQDSKALGARGICRGMAPRSIGVRLPMSHAHHTDTGIQTRYCGIHGVEILPAFRHHADIADAILLYSHA